MTIKNVTGNLEPFDWSSHARHYAHIAKLPFSPPVQGKIDMLIGLDNSQFHQCIREVPGGFGQPIARLGLLGWTCVGNTGLRKNSSLESRFANTFFLGSMDKINDSIKKFWEVDEGREMEPMSVSDKETMEQALKNMKYEYNKKEYEVSIPWKTLQTNLPNNYPLALKRLMNTEKKLLKVKELKDTYKKQ